MASDSTPVSLSAATLVQGSQTPTAAPPGPSSGKNSPPGGITPTDPRSGIAGISLDKSNPNATPTQGNGGRTPGSSSSATAIAAATNPAKASDAAPASTASADAASGGAHADVRTLVAQLNKALNDSGRPDQFRVDPQSSDTIQEVNPANGLVIAQFAASEFPTLARSVGASGLLFDGRA